MKHLIKVLPIIILGIVFFLSISINEIKNAAEKRDGLQKITIAQFGHLFLYLPLYIAQNEGLFEKEGLSVKLVSTGGDEKTFSAVASGSAQFGVADPTFTAIAREKGRGGKVVASIVNGATFWGVTYNKNIEKIKTAENFKGLRIATYTAPSTNYTIMNTILSNNGDAVSAEIVQGSFGSLLAILKAGNADIAMELEPVASIAVADGAKIVYSMVESYGDFAFTGLTATDKYLEKNPRTVQSVVNALERAMKFAHSNFEGTLKVAIKEFPEVEPSILRQALNRLLSEKTIPTSVVLSKIAWDKAIKIRHMNGDLPVHAGAYDINNDMSFAKQAVSGI